MSDLPDLAYVRPRDVAAARAALARPGAYVYAGGTDLLVALAERRPWTTRIRTLVDIKGLARARHVRAHGSRLRVGALVTAAEIAANALLRRAAPALAEAADATSSPALRRRGTLGGNIATPHPAGDVGTALLALDAVVELVDGDRTRRVPLVEILAADPTAWPRRRLLLAVSIRACPQSVYEKVGARAAFTRAEVAVALAVRPTHAAIAVAGLAPRPVRIEISTAALHAGRGVADAVAAANPRCPSDRLTLAADLIERAWRRVRP